MESCLGGRFHVGVCWIDRTYRYYVTQLNISGTRYCKSCSCSNHESPSLLRPRKNHYGVWSSSHERHIAATEEISDRWVAWSRFRLDRPSQLVEYPILLSEANSKDET